MNHLFRQPVSHDWLQPTAVMYVLYSGQLGEKMFGSRGEAESWLASITFLKEVGDLLASEIKMASIRPTGIGLN